MGVHLYFEPLQKDRMFAYVECRNVGATRGVRDLARALRAHRAVAGPSTTPSLTSARASTDAGPLLRTPALVRHSSCYISAARGPHQRETGGPHGPSRACAPMGLYQETEANEA